MKTPKHARAHDADAATGLVVASHGRHVMLEKPDGERLIAHPRGKKSEAVVGDRVRWSVAGDEARIEGVETRRNLLFRQDEMRTKSFAANLDQVLMLVAADPEYSEMQLARSLIAAEAAGIDSAIAVNKRDLAAPFERAWSRLARYRAMGYVVLPLSLKAEDTGLDAVESRLAGRATLVLGPSGAGKSSLVNRLVPGAAAETGEISRALASGKHTTTSTLWYWRERPFENSAGTAIIDSPGFQSFGLRHIEPMALASLMPDFAPFVGHCRFANCTHRHEPGCAVLLEVESADSPGKIGLGRYKIYSELFDELSEPERY